MIRTKVNEFVDIGVNDMEDPFWKQLSQKIDEEAAFKKKLREQLDDIDRYTRLTSLMTLFEEEHGLLMNNDPLDHPGHGGKTFTSRDFVDSEKAERLRAHKKAILAPLKELANTQPYYKFNGMWARQMEALSYDVILHYWALTFMESERNGPRPEPQLLSYEKVAHLLSLPTEDEDDSKLHLSLEEYLHSLITLTNELPRLAINSVTNGFYERPLAISDFIKNLYMGFQLLNLKNDSLRKRFDSMKYDVKKIEEVIYDLSLRGLLPKKREGPAKGEGLAKAESAAKPEVPAKAEAKGPTRHEELKSPMKNNESKN